MIHCPEPESDLLAQMRAMVVGVKKCVFISNTNLVPDFHLPSHCFICRRPEGTLLTLDEHAARMFLGAPFLTESLMATLLEYPQSKDHLHNPIVVQIRNPEGAVLWECATDDAEETKNFATKFCGTAIELSVYDAIRRRMELINGTV